MTPSASVIILSGGKGKRFDKTIPKQYHLLHDKPIVRHCFDLFCSMPYVKEIIVVCEESYRDYFDVKDASILFAEPGQRRQDSLHNGLQKVSRCDVVLVHDAARPFVDPKEIANLIAAAMEFGGAALATKCIATIKESKEDDFVKKTLDRNNLWELQTPQAIRSDLVNKDFLQLCLSDTIYTDDVMILEAMGQSVKLLLSSRKNIKITTPFDLMLATLLVKNDATI